MNKQHPLYVEDLNSIIKIHGFNLLYGKTFLITGATGLIGVCLIDALMEANKKEADITIYAIGRNKAKAQEWC